MIVVAIPWRPTPARKPAFRAVVRWWNEHLPAAPVLTVDTGHVPYNLSAVRNEAVRQAESVGADVVILADADGIIATPASLHAAIRDAADGRLHLPFTEQRYLDREETRMILERLEPGPPAEGSPGNGAMYVVTPAGYWAASGSDERFSGWGGDDDGLVAAAQTLTGVVRHDGVVWSLWHADERRPVGTVEHRPNAELADRYWRAVGNRTAMLRLIAERDYPGAVVEAVA